MTSEIRANTLKNRVGLGTVSFTDTGPVVSGIVTANGLELNSVDAGSSAGPEFKLFRNSASPADADYLGQLKFAGESDTGVERNYAKITGKILDASNGTEDGILEFAHIKAGSQTITGRWRSDSLQLLNGTNFSVAGTSSFTGAITANGGLTVPDGDVNNNYISAGDSQDIKIYHDGSHSYIRDIGTGGLRITTNSFNVLNSVNNESMITATEDGAVKLYYNHNLRLETEGTRTLIRGSGGLGIYGDSGSNQNGHLTLHPTGSAVYTNLFFYNAAGNSYASIIGHDGGTLFFTGGTNGPLRHRVNGTGFHSFQEGNTQRVTITAGGTVNIGGDFTNTTGKLKVTGNSIFTGDIDAQGSINLADSIIHTGDTDTKIALTDNQIDIQTGGASRAYVNNYGVYVSSGFALAFLSSSGATPHIKSGGTNYQDLLFTTGSGNPTRLSITSDGEILMGHDTSRDVFKETRVQISGANGDDAGLSIYSTENGNAGPNLILAHSRGGGAVNNNTVLGDITFVGHDSTDLNSRASVIRSVMTANGTNNSLYADLIFYTKRNAGGYPDESLRITSGGAVGIDETSPEQRLHVKHSDNSDIYGGIIVKSNNNTVRIKYGWGGMDGSSLLRFGIAGDEKIRISSEGIWRVGRLTAIAEGNPAEMPRVSSSRGYTSIGRDQASSLIRRFGAYRGQVSGLKLFSIGSNGAQTWARIIISTILGTPSFGVCRQEFLYAGNKSLRSSNYSGNNYTTVVTLAWSGDELQYSCNNSNYYSTIEVELGAPNDNASNGWYPTWGTSW